MDTCETFRDTICDGGGFGLLLGWCPDIYDIEIVCSLQADLETDEVYAQMTLIPTSNSVSVG
jgi:hypothetical protein